MGAQAGGQKGAAFQIDSINRARQGAARRREALSRRNRGPGSPGRPGRPSVMEPGRDRPVRDPSREQLDAVKNQFGADDEQGIKKGGGPGDIKRPGDPGLRPPSKPGEGADVGIGGGPGPIPPRFPGGAEGPHILKEGRDAEMRSPGMRFGPGRSSRTDRGSDSTRPGIQFGDKRSEVDTGPRDMQGFKDFLLKLEQMKASGGIK